ncbi:MAG: 4-alpha-glucanotransferase [Simkaniaceae bacterium]|nr:4-alpha-glucanotransferase [Simkaniaceae bacterium]
MKKKPHHGINIPLSAIHSKNSCGIGEYLDLLPLIDWLSDIGMDCLQLLPLNDSGPDPSPYNSETALALHPVYLSLHALPNNTHPLPQLPIKKWVDYAHVLREKLNWLHTYVQENPVPLDDFIKHHEYLKPYALFKVLKDVHGGQNFNTWRSKNLSHSEFDQLVVQYWPEMLFYLQLQYHAHAQLSFVKQYAEEKGVFLKGDLPILISPDSADVWHHPEYFDCSKAAGAPPDAFNPMGQYWGFPIYKWEVLEKDHFAFWKNRLHFSSAFYHLFRIDHVLGFFRIWAIEKEAPAATGYFIPDDEAIMISQGKTLLEMVLTSSPMVPIAEDLGFYSDKIRQALRDLHICGTRVLRWEKNEENTYYTPYDQYDPLSLTTLSTHDSPTLEQWWDEESDEASLYARQMGLSYETPLTHENRRTMLHYAHHSTSLFHINLLQEYLSLFPELKWPNPDDERINLPGFVLPTNWTYRYRPSVEEIISHPHLKNEMKKVIL